MGIPITEVPQPKEALPQQSASGMPTYQTSRAIREAYSAKITRVEFETRIGKLVDKSEVLSTAFDLARKTRDRILSIPSRVAANISALAPGTDVVQIERVLDSELRAALEELSTILKDQSV